MSTITKDLGAVTAYAYAVEQGYTGTEEEFAELMADYAAVEQRAAQSATAASAAAEAAQQAGTSAGGSATAAEAAQAAAQSAANLATQSAASAQADATAAAQSATSAAEAQQTTQQTAQNSEAWAVGQRDGDDVGVSDPTYHNNSKWYAQQAGTSEQSAGQSATGAASSAQAAAQSAAEAAESARTLTIDPTLTQPGQAADAKVVGDEIGELKSALDDLYNSALTGKNTVSGNVWIEFPFVKGRKYIFTKKSGSYGAVAKTVNASGSYDYIDSFNNGNVISTNDVGYEITASTDAAYIVVYANGTTDWEIKCAEDITQLSNRITTLSGIVETNAQTAAQGILANESALNDVYSNTATKEYTAQGTGWLQYNIKAGHIYRIVNIGSSRFTDLETTNSVGYTYIEQIANGFNVGAIIEFIPTQDAKYIYAYAAGSTEYSVTDLTANKVLFDDLNTQKEVDLVVNENVMSVGNAFAGNSEYITLNPMWEIGGLNNSTGADWDSYCSIKSQFIFSGVSVELHAKALSSVNSAAIVFYDAEKTYTGYSSINANSIINIEANTYFRVWIYGTAASPADVDTPTEYLLISIANGLYDSIPEYYKSYMATKITEILNASNYVKGITFPFITDVHLQANAMQSGKLIKYIDEKTNAVPFVVFGGDVPKAIDTAENVIGYANAWNEYMNQWGKHKTIQVHGNHDYMCRVEGTTTNWFAPLSTVFKYIKDNSYYYMDSPAGALYGAVDIPSQMIKIIVADNYDSTYNVTNDTWNGSTGMSNDQLKWMAETILDSDGYSILFVTHSTTLSGMGVAEETTALKPFDDFVKAVKNKQTYTVDGETFNFSAWTGEVVAELSGHMHKDSSGTSDGVLYIGVTCDCYVDSDPNVERTRGTVTEQAFDIVNIDTVNKTIKLVRVGGGSSRAWNYSTGTELS